MTARRRWLRAALAAALGGIHRGPAAAAAAAAGTGSISGVQRGRLLVFPRDFGAHPQTRIEWWYVTGWLRAAASGSAASAASAADAADAAEALTHGFQITFFRSRTGLADDLPGRFAPRQLLFAHAAVTDLTAGRHLHAQRLLRWDGRTEAGEAHALLGDTGVALAGWALRRDSANAANVADGAYRALAGEDSGEQAFAFDLSLRPTQPVLLQGDRGFSRKGPLEDQASHYYSLPQLAVTGRLRTGATTNGIHSTGWRHVTGTAWLDHEWSDTVLAPDAVGWDWAGIDLLDGGALMAFRVRRADGSALWAGGSLRRPGQAVRVFAPDEVEWQPGRRWTSPATGASYPVEWTLRTPAGNHRLRALLDAQELDGGASTGAVYWEGLSDLLDANAPGALLGRGYLEMTGYAQRLRLGQPAAR